jgi:hypothetical protein
MIAERPFVRANDKDLPPCRECSAGLDQGAAGRFALITDEQADIGL